jgi:hypothetical protein
MDQHITKYGYGSNGALQQYSLSGGAQFSNHVQFQASNNNVSFSFSGPEGQTTDNALKLASHICRYPNGK